MTAADALRAWKLILSGRTPALSIEITRECPLRCPGCYAYEPNHLGAGPSLRELNDYRGQELVARVLDIVDRAQPLHVSLVGGDPLVRYRELEVLVPSLIARGIEVQVVTSAFRRLPDSWIGLDGLDPVVSIDGLAPEHDVRRRPATYERILKNISGHRITVHCTVTAQMTERRGYLDEFALFWAGRDEVKKIWFSLFTPQRDADPAEKLTSEQRRGVVMEMKELRLRYAKIDMPVSVLEEFLAPPSSPQDCVFARTTETISADLATRITPCQFGGDPDCSQCGCYASMGLAAVGAHRLGGLVSVFRLLRMSQAIGDLRARREARHAVKESHIPELVVLRTSSEEANWQGSSADTANVGSMSGSPRY